MLLYWRKQSFLLKGAADEHRWWDTRKMSHEVDVRAFHCEEAAEAWRTLHSILLWCLAGGLSSSHTATGHLSKTELGDT